MKYAYPLLKMCEWLSVSRSGFYEWRTRPASATAERRERLKKMITAVFEYNHGCYGYRRIHAVLVDSGKQVSAELVRVLMRELGLIACQPRPYRPTTTVGGQADGIADLVGRDFTAAAPGTKLVGDMTYIKTWEGWLYLATVIDCCTKMVVGWSMAGHMKTSLVISAIEMAADNIEIHHDAIFHSDRGSQYSSVEYRTKLASLGIRSSMGRTGVCWDNAMAESFNGALKNEWVNRMVFATRDKARREIVKYIEGFYNRQRLHSGLGYKTPLEVHQESINQQLAA